MEQVYGLYATGVWLPFVGWVGVRPFGFVRQYGVLFGVAFAVAADWMIDKATK
jgi:hypothetical protein